MDAIAFIFARGGSKGLPGKNIRPFAGKPLLAWSIEHAKAVKRIRRVIVSTDSSEIAGVAREYGAETPFIRPASLSADDSSEWLAWRHALDFVREEEGAYPEAMVSVPTTAPLRIPEDLEKCLDLFQEGDADLVITVTEAHRSPFFNMVRQHEDLTYGLVTPPEKDLTRRQDTPTVYDMTTVGYVADPRYVMRENSLFAGRVKAVHIPKTRSIDIDTMLDFQTAEFLYNLNTKE
jgi:CMP-N-acetylneuraminic acid synthetase